MSAWFSSSGLIDPDGVVDVPRLKGIETTTACIISTARVRRLSLSACEARAMAERVCATNNLSTEKWIDAIAEALRRYEHG